MQYFPMLIPQSFMTKEAEHVRGICPGTYAVVTVRRRGKVLDEPLVLHTSDIGNYYLFDVRKMGAVPIAICRF